VQQRYDYQHPVQHAERHVPQASTGWRPAETEPRTGTPRSNAASPQVPEPIVSDLHSRGGITSC
jgi:hypothetical protein